MNDITPADDLRPLEPVIGRWRTSGTVLDEDGRPAATIDGTDVYRWLTGGHWVVHDVDVMMGDQRAEALELIGDLDPATGAYAMRAFDASGGYSTMTLSVRDDGSLVGEGDGVRSTLRPATDGSSMTALWERRDASGGWTRWMDMHFARLE